VNRSKAKILIADRFPSLNKGELAILRGILETFNRLSGGAEVTVFSFSLESDAARYPKNVRLLNVNRSLCFLGRIPEDSRFVTLNGILAMIQHLLFGFFYFILGKGLLRLAKSDIWKEYCSTDVIITCHDQESCLFGPSTMPFLPLYVTLLAKTIGKPVVIYGNGTYKFKRVLWKELARYVLDNVDLVTTREKETFEYFRQIATSKSHIFLAADPAFLMPPVGKEAVRNIMKRESIKLEGRLSIGITITNAVLLTSRNQQGLLTDHRPVDAFAHIIDSLIERFQATIVFLPHNVGTNIQTDDRFLAGEIYARAKNKKYIVVITNEYSAEELKGLINSFDLFIGGRIHSVIGAVSLGVPSIIMTRPSDIRGSRIIGELMSQREWVYEVKDHSLNGLLSKIENLIGARKSVSKNLIHQALITKAMAYKNGELLKVVLRGHSSIRS
jgi:colanic acid/amylovoran biosynthesis protein